MHEILSEWEFLNLNTNIAISFKSQYKILNISPSACESRRWSFLCMQIVQTSPVHAIAPPFSLVCHVSDVCPPRLASPQNPRCLLTFRRSPCRSLFRRRLSPPCMSSFRTPPCVYAQSDVPRVHDAPVSTAVQFQWCFVTLFTTPVFEPFGKSEKSH
jgi:hypothetical protein